MSNIGLFGNTKVGKMPITGHVMDGKFVSAVLNMPLMSEDREALIWGPELDGVVLDLVAFRYSAEGGIAVPPVGVYL